MGFLTASCEELKKIQHSFSVLPCKDVLTWRYASVPTRRYILASRDGVRTKDGTRLLIKTTIFFMIDRYIYLIPQEDKYMENISSKNTQIHSKHIARFNEL